ncbi:imelysin family protein [Tamlana sp. 2_MG-2023]|uniref:imelysin family protein n=1 Tax=unclassified Tamlana TaxID=2614803 RepID=UPI0026E33D92|nr:MULTISPECIES: imelysin family protein [unclassified Tamlana]MDO6759312.1 imelysin family protein [Tamlana sp. 2_MG-2023]MDO6790549.1 imelysin family protein [Tamlana sp. 1_MG-2023]
MRKCILSLLLLAVAFTSCDKDDSVTKPIETLHEDYYSKNIEPAISNFKIEIEKQIELSEAFKTDPSDSNFNKLQKQWFISAKAFSKTRAYNVVAVKAKYFDLHIHNFPINPDQIESNIEENGVYDTAYLSSKSTVSKGLGAIEYLLYNNQDSDAALLLLQNDAFRIDYMLGVSKEILRQADLLISFWEDGYKETFLNARNVSCVENARCLAFNQLINVIDVIRVTKVGKPSGLENSNNASLESLEAYRSGSSLALLRSALKEVQYAYTLSDANFANIIEDISDSNALTNETNNAFQAVFMNIDSIDTSLYVAISNDNPNVELLYNSLFDLVKYFSVDAASILSVTVLPTDNDGD